MSRAMYVPRRYQLFGKLERGAALIWDRQLSDALNTVGKDLSPSEAYFAIFEAGVHTILDREEVEGQDDRDVQRALAVIRLEKERRQRMGKLYEEMGLDRFVSWCEAHGRDWEGFLDEYRLFSQRETKSWSERAAMWLRDYLRGGEPVATSDIKQAAIEHGIVDDTNAESENRDWAKMRQVAHREGLTGEEWGTWRYRASPFGDL